MMQRNPKCNRKLWIIDFDYDCFCFHVCTRSLSSWSRCWFLLIWSKQCEVFIKLKKKLWSNNNIGMSKHFITIYIIYGLTKTLYCEDGSVKSKGSRERSLRWMSYQLYEHLLMQQYKPSLKLQEDEMEIQHSSRIRYQSNKWCSHDFLIST
jgi:hypothetical protein